MILDAYLVEHHLDIVTIPPAQRPQPCEKQSFLTALRPRVPESSFILSLDFNTETMIERGASLPLSL